MEIFVRAARAWIFDDLQKSKVNLSSYLEHRKRLALLRHRHLILESADPQSFFIKWDWFSSPLGDDSDSGLDGARVPRKKAPDTGAGEIALPLPVTKDEL